MSTKLNVKLITENLADELIAGMQNASGIYIMTSFVMHSGVRLLAPHLKRALDHGAEVRMLAGDYLFVSQPDGLRALKEIDDRLEAQLWRSAGTSFHPKAYLLDYENGEGLLIVGSSNFSLSAMRMQIGRWRKPGSRVYIGRPGREIQMEFNPAHQGWQFHAAYFLKSDWTDSKQVFRTNSENLVSTIHELYPGN
ncbi:phospholipase D-like domain-containing protein [Paenibacillus eucommiae]|uniref:PLD phosphodiesterase domain-containing protein n=1 Tax=Paenibacillus eucommiae TaxID=1355755 RepID=A0ABS4J5D0_9BACL|nr:phospholipase D-like domain-containing protein [Paenibacillus eucommiae]MBP1994316.1 hypothetical protein [Paenibacillus eucommiae]